VRSLLVLIVVAACSHPASAPSNVASAWKGPEILAAVPADTPYAIAVLDPMPAAVRDQLLAQSGTQIRKALEKAAGREGKGAKLAAVMLHHLEGVPDARWLDAFGFSGDTRFVIYGLSVWPVMRVEVKDRAKVQKLLDEVMTVADVGAIAKRPDDRHIVFMQGEKVSFVVALLDHELVAAMVPGDKLTQLMPVIDGTEKPQQSLRESPVLPSMMAKHRFLSTMILFADFQRGLDAMTGHGHGQYDNLDTMFAGLITPPCEADIGRIVSVMPRVVLGYRKLDEHGFTATMAVEAPASLIKALAKLHTTMPAMPVGTQPLFAMGAAVNLDAALDWMKETTHSLRATPFRCDALASMNHDIDDLASKLDEPLPPMAHGWRGFELVIDDASVMPPGGTGHVLVAADHMADIIHMLLAKLPMTAALQVPATGAAVALPVDQLGVPGIKSAHLALQPTKAALAIGDNSAARATARLSAPDAHAPLMSLSYDLPKVRERFGMFLKDSDLDSFSTMGSTSLALDVGDDGIYVDMVGTWAHGR